MSAPTKGFNPKQALLSRLDTIGGGEWATIAQIARSSLAQLESDGAEEDSVSDQSEWREVFTPAAFSRKVTIFAGQPINSERVMNLNELYHNESKLLRDAQDLTLSEMFLKDDDNNSTEKSEREEVTGKAKAVRFTDGDHLLLLRAYATMIRE